VTFYFRSTAWSCNIFPQLFRLEIRRWHAQLVVSIHHNSVARRKGTGQNFTDDHQNSLGSGKRVLSGDSRAIRQNHMDNRQNRLGGWVGKPLRRFTRDHTEPHGQSPKYLGAMGGESPRGIHERSLISDQAERHGRTSKSHQRKSRALARPHLSSNSIEEVWTPESSLDGRNRTVRQRRFETTGKSRNDGALNPSMQGGNSILQS
jgi:hypothetical protein